MANSATARHLPRRASWVAALLVLAALGVVFSFTPYHHTETRLCATCGAVETKSWWFGVPFGTHVEDKPLTAWLTARHGSHAHTWQFSYELDKYTLGTGRGCGMDLSPVAMSSAAMQTTLIAGLPPADLDALIAAMGTGTKRAQQDAFSAALDRALAAE